MLAVIIPVRNTADWAQTLRSVLTGHRIPDECFVIDDGSEPALQFPDDISYPETCRLVRIEPSGPAAARNCGVAQTQADILVFVDADVTVSATTLQELERRLNDSSSDVAAIQTLYSPLSVSSNFPTAFQNALQRYNFLHSSDPENFLGLSSYCIAVRREAFLAVGGFDESVGRATIEDDTLGLNLVRAGWRIRLVPEIEVLHRANYCVSGLAKRMFRMASDKVRSVRRQPWTGRIPVAKSHHRPAFLASSLVAALTLILAPIAPVWSLYLIVPLLGFHLPLLVHLIRENGLMFGVRSAAIMLVLSYAAALGSIAGLWS